VRALILRAPAVHRSGAWIKEANDRVRGIPSKLTIERVHDERLCSLRKHGTHETNESGSGDTRTNALHPCRSRRDNRETESETSYGIWWGADVIREGAERRDGMAELECTEEQGRGAIAQGLEGGRLPDNWDVLDAELYAIFRALKRVHVESKRRKENPKEKRLLVLTDCKSAIEILEQAWRRERVRTWGDRARLVEAICNVRKEIGVCVLCKVQSHVGVAPNEYADAAAKAHLEAPAEEIEDAVAQMERYLLRAQWVHEERLRGGTWSMTDRAMYATARKRGTVYARRKMNEGVKRNRYCAAAWGPIWEEMAKEAMKYDTTTAEEWTEVQAHNDAIGIIMGARSGDTAGVPHEQGWARREGKGVPWEEKTEAQRAETCAAMHGCGACRRSKTRRSRRSRRRACRYQRRRRTKRYRWRRSNITHWSARDARRTCARD
jgi:ribonuclease HI